MATTGIKAPRPNRPRTGQPAVRRAITRDVEKHLLSCVPSPVYEPKLAEEHGVSTRTIRNYAARVRAEWAKIDNLQKEDRRREHALILQSYYQKCLAAGDMKSAGIALHRLAQLFGLYAPVEVKISDVGVVDPAEIRREIAELAAKFSPSLVAARKTILAGANGSNGANGHGGDDGPN